MGDDARATPEKPRDEPATEPPARDHEVRTTGVRSAPVEDTLKADRLGSSPRSSRAGMLRDLEPGTILDAAYRVVRKIGGGAMGAVYLVEHLRLGRRFAAKVVAAVHAEDAEILARLQNEARVASSVQHENIVDVVHLGPTGDGSLFVVMEFLEGHDLRHRLAERAREGPTPWLPDDEVRWIVRDILKGAHAAHEAGVVHRDLKPDNVFLAKKGTQTRAKIVDFGISIVHSSADDLRLTATGQIIGTPLYMAPEQTRSSGVDRRADIYSLGVILYEMITGRLPFEAKTIYDLIVQHATTTPRSPSDIRPELPPRVGALVLRCLAKSPDDRYPTAEALLVAWEDAWRGAPASAPPPPSEVRDSGPLGVRSAAPAAGTPVPPAPITERPPPLGRGRLIATSALAVVLLVGAGVVWSLDGPTTPAVPRHPPPPVHVTAPPVHATEPPHVIAPPLPPPVPPAPDVTRRIETEPAGAELLVGGEALCTTPCPVVLAAGAPVEITLRLAGHRTQTRIVTTADPEAIPLTLVRTAHTSHTAPTQHADPDLPTLAPH